MRYGVVFEVAPDGSVGAHIPDMPGVGVVGEDRSEALQLLRHAVGWHVEAMIQDATPLPDASETDFDTYITLDTTVVARLRDERLRDKVTLAGDPYAAPYLHFEITVPTLRVSAPVPA
jgi:predicted RNase H-like HicB family nuclease